MRPASALSATQETLPVERVLAAGQSQTCWTGPASARGVGACHDGTQACVAQTQGEITSLTWGPCLGEQLDCGDAAPGEALDAGVFPPFCGSDVTTLPIEADVILAYSPTSGQTVSENGQIKVWVTDECPPFIAPNEQLDPSTGAITSPGDQTAKYIDGYFQEPALYIAPETAEKKGKPYFPTAIKGAYDNGYYTDPNFMNCGTSATTGTVQGVDPLPSSAVALQQKYVAEDIWDVASLHLCPGTYVAEFLIPDGDLDRAVGCTQIVIEGESGDCSCVGSGSAGNGQACSSDANCCNGSCGTCDGVCGGRSAGTSGAPCMSNDDCCTARRPSTGRPQPAQVPIALLPPPRAVVVPGPPTVPFPCVEY